MHTKKITPLVPEGEVVIVWANPGELARTVISRSNQKVTFKVPSLKTGEMLYAESQNECDFVRRTDADPSVTRVVMQPAKLLYWDDGILRTHYPDCLVMKTTPYEGFVEIKSANDPILAEARRRGDLISPSLLRQGYGYEVVTSAAIRAAPYFNNARTLLRFGRKPIAPIDAEAIRLMLGQRPETTWRHIVTGLLGPRAPFHVARMILDGVLTYDASKILGASTVISPLPATL